jgi:hypothetical protein
MSFREVRAFEVREVLRLWLRGEGLRTVERMAGVDRKTVRRYVAAAVESGLDRTGGEDQLTDLLIAVVVEKVRPCRTDGRGQSWRTLEPPPGVRIRPEQVSGMVRNGCPESIGTGVRNRPESASGSPAPSLHIAYAVGRRHAAAESQS